MTACRHGQNSRPISALYAPCRSTAGAGGNPLGAGAPRATRLYLESNTSLVPAISLYRKLWFREVTGGASPYARCDIRMEKAL